MRDDEIVNRARALLEQHVDRDEQGRGICLYATLCILLAAKDSGRQIVLQAGSAMWRRVSEEDDDGVEPTFFGYEWCGPGSPDPATCLEAGILPEIHIWAGDLQTQEIIDPTTAWQASRCEALSRHPFLMPELPECLWASQEAVHQVGWYRPNAEATQLAGELMVVEAERLGILPALTGS